MGAVRALGGWGIAELQHQRLEERLADVALRVVKIFAGFRRAFSNDDEFDAFWFELPSKSG